MTPEQVHNAMCGDLHKQLVVCAGSECKHLEAIKMLVQDERDRCLKAVEAEEELNGPMPDENWVMSQRVRLEDHLRATVRVVKRNIMKRIREGTVDKIS